MSAPSPSKLRERESPLSEANDMMALERRHHAHMGPSPAHSCVLAVTQARERALSAEVDAQRGRLDAPKPFGPNAVAGAFPFQSTSSFRGRSMEHDVLIPRFDRLPGNMPAVRGHGGIGPGHMS